MPSVAQPFINGVEFGHKDKLGEPARTGFTAVNGRGSPPQPHKTNGVSGTNGMPASDTINVTPITRNSSEEQDRKVPVPQREGWQYPTTNGNGHRIVTPPNGVERTATGSPGKRKRSDSEEEANGYRAYENATSQARRRVASYDSVQEDDSPNTVSHSLPVSIEHPVERSGSTWQSRQRAENMNESQFAEALQRDSRSMESNGDRDGSPDGGSMTADGDTQNQGDRSSTTELTRAGVQVDPKKRKRVRSQLLPFPAMINTFQQFANRTKTGCQTCRRRKKKCDEAKPECSNCIRGGFICEGYAHKATWTKPSLSKAHVPLQAKDRFSEQSGLYHTHGHPRESYAEPHASSHVDGARTRPIVVDEVERPAPRTAWNNGWPEQPRPYAQEPPPPHDYQQPPPMAPRPRQYTHEYEHSMQPAAIAQRPPPAPPGYGQNVQNIGTSQSAMTAQLALQHHTQGVHPRPPQQHVAPPPEVKQPKSEKEKMLSGEHYMLFNPQLVDEREQCKASLFRFNNGSNPGGGISREERARLFREVLEPKWVKNLRSPHNSPIGSLGKDVCVDAPFTCEYGYNINIGDEVVLGSNCTILDPCRIIIMARTIIGPNVNIFGNTVSTDPRARKGSKGTAIGKEIIIEEDVYIGGNVTILPGVTIGKGATVGAGSVVTHVSPFRLLFVRFYMN
ncbi:hypothetical protein BU16DRAFT_134671 [Lophium mytilinum]|uniref:Zn(2)-C6 fungal-type domain-containing protein n=1 Tax=Lophium mytilinum TaxID=390894 RepID=A0A6A6QH26_9PEZI|nr:hypothetical protein BU16DRAFT_134671 [Lophium mytilinum]